MMPRVDMTLMGWVRVCQIHRCVISRQELQQTNSEMGELFDPYVQI